MHKIQERVLETECVSSVFILSGAVPDVLETPSKHECTFQRLITLCISMKSLNLQHISCNGPKLFKLPLKFGGNCSV